MWRGVDDRKMRRIQHPCIVIIAVVVLATGCSARPSEPSPSSKATGTSSAAAVDAVFTCADAYRITSSGSPADLRLGPLRYAGGASMATTTLPCSPDHERATVTGFAPGRTDPSTIPLSRSIV